MKASSKSLAAIYDLLPEQDQKALFDFAEFLKSRAPEIEPQVMGPLDIPRPENESVIAAITSEQNLPYDQASLAIARDIKFYDAARGLRQGSH